jgi:hypothetical protein
MSISKDSSHKTVDKKKKITYDLTNNKGEVK